VIGVCYYPEQWPEQLWPEDLARMRALGISLVRIGEFAWSRLEPEPGRWDFGWLERVLDQCAAAGLQVVLGTPTATPPQWLVEAHPEILPVDRAGRTRGFGSRRHYDFASEVYLEECARAVSALAERFGQHPAVVGWQIDNEFGCHDTARSYSPAAREGFQAWLAERYGEVSNLNRAWGNSFWSQEYPRFSSVGLPNLTVTEANPAHWLDFYRYASQQVERFARRQLAILRRLSPGRWVTHNFMGMFTDFDHYAVARDLDLAAWDSYPLGFADLLPLPEEERRRWERSGHPDLVAFHHDLYRGVGQGRFLVMEQQPGPVNWAPHNPSPAPGVVRLWTMEALAHGAEAVCYFRWPPAPWAQEQMHSGLLRPDGSPDQGFSEVARVARELPAIRGAHRRRAPVALLFDYQADWVFRIQPQGVEQSYFELAFAFYCAARQLGLDLDILPPDGDLHGYSLVLIPSLPVFPQALARALAASGVAALIGPRSGSKTAEFQIPQGLPPGPLAELLPLRVLRAESLRPRAEVLRSGAQLARVTWREQVESELEPMDRFGDGWGALYRAGAAWYLPFSPDPAWLTTFLAERCAELGLPARPLGPALRTRRLGQLTFAFNYGAEPCAAPAPAGAHFLIGEPELGPYDLCAWE
jgi:beta-galactosidase